MREKATPLHSLDRIFKSHLWAEITPKLSPNAFFYGIQNTNSPAAFTPTGYPKGLQHWGHTIAPSHRSWNLSSELRGYEGVLSFLLRTTVRVAPGTDLLLK